MIKNKIMQLLIGLLLFATLPAWSTCPLGLTNESVTPRPMDYKKEANASIRVYNPNNVSIPANDGFSPTCKFTIQLSLIELKNHDLSEIIYNPTLNNLKSYFDITYNIPKNSLHFIQKADIPADWYNDIRIPVDVAEQSTSAASANGYRANVFASSNEISVFTYTNAVTLVANDVNGSIDGIIGGLTIVNITANDTINGEAIDLGEDINISSITNLTPLVVDTLTGSVSVPAATVAGTYVETYTICKSHTITTCDSATVTIIVSSKITHPTSDDGDTLKTMSLIMMLFMTLLTGLYFIRQELQ